MARVARLSSVAVLDTSWLLELYRVPGYFEESRTLDVQDETEGVVKAGGELFVTVPVLFELASHITHVPDGGRRQQLGKRLLKDIRNSFDRDRPWTIVTIGRDVLLRSEDVIHLAERFLEEAGPNYSFANISIINLAHEIQRRRGTVRILTFNKRLGAYSG